MKRAGEGGGGDKVADRLLDARLDERVLDIVRDDGGGLEILEARSYCWTRSRTVIGEH